MPAIVGAVQVISVGSSGVFNIGDVYKIMPVSSAKTFAGAGSFNTGESLEIINKQNATNAIDQDTLDQPSILNL
ncbi:spore germination protein [Bacillus aquiflavi]|uniref:Spore germination protein n=1 Tax=Bacillus aquiflavi TaxID=2672567 RepID=A0A6B3W0R5_9BACI|nr:spore germination protein [Bacillus aquiflavi]MBA4538739.1 spore germination protein [Bacillus aquiflavi]NEY83098.1 spore germination protein [Bacillus aquiflavi]UAC49038.1 spore germination protein [Bacillus aquiflavi]